MLVAGSGPYEFPLKGLSKYNLLDNFWSVMTYKVKNTILDSTDNKLLLNAGDTIDNKDRDDLPVFKDHIQNMLFDASTIGNHDISRGIYHFRDFSEKYNLPLTACNYYYKGFFVI